ncbi:MULTISPECIES: SlyX family protein [Kaistia]|uniref:Protein SlyX homolog n=1 Tax=Kaistia nematophila TaxID=2994654 RepID=A0A9X3E994_9HYPH|nr:SlyX family protein [Kaistia nematophila]MBN9024320.1 SlyX family protein [Hyphomicrobiales bacterium]MCX5571783.1 SlyX family protein [Kaistia nematophila]
MTDTNAEEALASRIEALEIRIAYQDETIEDLNSAITAQWKQVDLLTRKIAQLTEQLRETSEQIGRPNLPEPPPPHY